MFYMWMDFTPLGNRCTMMQVNIPWGMPKLCNSTTVIVAMILPLKGPQRYRNLHELYCETVFRQDAKYPIYTDPR